MHGDHPVEGSQGHPDVQFLLGVPTQLNRMLVEGEKSISALLSSIAYARNHKDLLLSAAA